MFLNSVESASKSWAHATALEDPIPLSQSRSDDFASGILTLVCNYPTLLYYILDRLLDRSPSVRCPTRRESAVHFGLTALAIFRIYRRSLLTVLRRVLQTSQPAPIGVLTFPPSTSEAHSQPRRFLAHLGADNLGRV
jgi:hypothetical protein